MSKNWKKIREEAHEQKILPLSSSRECGRSASCSRKYRFSWIFNHIGLSRLLNRKPSISRDVTWGALCVLLASARLYSICVFHIMLFCILGSSFLSSVFFLVSDPLCRFLFHFCFVLGPCFQRRIDLDVNLDFFVAHFTSSVCFLLLLSPLFLSRFLRWFCFFRLLLSFVSVRFRFYLNLFFVGLLFFVFLFLISLYSVFFLCSLGKCICVCVSFFLPLSPPYFVWITFCGLFPFSFSAVSDYLGEWETKIREAAVCFTHF